MAHGSTTRYAAQQSTSREGKWGRGQKIERVGSYEKGIARVSVAESGRVQCDGVLQYKARIRSAIDSLAGTNK